MATSFWWNFETLMSFFLFPLDFLFSFLANMERSNLYLKLFKLVFGSVSLFASENEQMLKVGWLLFEKDVWTM